MPIVYDKDDKWRWLKFYVILTMNMHFPNFSATYHFAEVKPLQVP